MAFKMLVILGLAAILNSVLACAPTGQSCNLPGCACPSLDIPAGLTPEETPQIVYLTFDDAVNIQNYEMYEELIFPYKNPNDAPISATFYITHKYNNYSMTHDLWRKGHEIALHSITHQTDPSYWATLNTSMWEWEVTDQRGLISNLANIPKIDIKGFRAPFLQTGGDPMMEVLYNEDLTYDCSRPTRNYIDPGLWPYTANYDQTFQDCQIEPCSVGSYPSFWIVPMVDFIGDNGEPCAMLDTCRPVANTTMELFTLLKRNFERHYNGTRAPFGAFTHAALFQGEQPEPIARRAGYKMFVEYLLEKEDVYIVSVAKAIEWFRKPTKLAEIKEFAPWLHQADQPNNCRAVYNCNYEFGEENLIMPSCKVCPPVYPWLKNPYGQPLE